MAVDIAEFKQVMRRFVTGVMVLTVPDGEGMHAVTVNGLTSVSLRPLLMLVCLEKTAYSHGLVQQAGAFALNILSDEQKELGERFAFDREARRNPAVWARGHKGTIGALIFEDTLGFLECRVTAEFPGGDHTIFLAEVISAQLGDSAAGPLVYYEGQFRNIKA